MRSLGLEHVPEHDPLIDSQPVDDDERDPGFGIVREPPAQIARQMVHHRRRIGGLVVKPRVAALGPGQECPGHLGPEFGQMPVDIRSGGCGRIRAQNVELRPTPGERRPLAVPRLGARDRIGGALDQTLEAPALVRIGIDPYPRRDPVVWLDGVQRMGHGMQHPFHEQNVDIDANVLVVKRHDRGTADLRVEPLGHVQQVGLVGPQDAVEEQGPALLQEGEEGVPVRDDGLQRP